MMDRLGAELTELAEEAAAGATAAGATAARRRGAHRRHHQTAATALLVVGLVAGSVLLNRWAASPAPPIATATSTPTTTLPWYPFDPTGTPDLHLRGKPVLITQRTFAGRPFRLWAYQATLGKKPALQICVDEDQPGGSGSGGCAPASQPASITSAIGPQVQLVDGFVSKRAALVRLELARAGRPLPPIVVRPLPGGPHLPANVWFATIGRTVEVSRVVLLDAFGKEVGHARGI